jgi:excisionase family DNA binding protein
MNDPALSPKEVAQQLGLCTRTVLKRIHSGEIEPAYRINQRVIRIPQSAVTEYLKPAIVGTAGTGATAILDGVNAAVGILVGLATLVYLVVRIRKELKK